MPAGRWYWTVAPRFAGWIGEESKKSENLRFTAPEPTALVANTSAAKAPPARLDRHTAGYRRRSRGTAGYGHRDDPGQGDRA